MVEKKALGKGISALIPEREAQENRADIMLVDIKKIRANPYQPRENFDSQNLAELTQSIKEKGVLQPVLVRRQGEYYELIAGERRLRAANMLNLKEIPVIIKDVADQDSLELSLIENIQRQDLNPIEEARAYQYLVDKFNLTQERISEILGKARTSVANILRILKLPQEIQERIKKGEISFAHGRTLLEVEDANQQRRLVHEIITKGLSVRELESLIRKYRPKASKTRMRLQVSRETLVVAAEEELQQILATKVRISKRQKRGNIVIEFYSQEDLERIVKRIKGGGSS